MTEPKEPTRIEEAYKNGYAIGKAWKCSHTPGGPHVGSDPQDNKVREAWRKGWKQAMGDKEAHKTSQ